jgi:DNA polymerase-3 subunit beta
MKFFVDCKELLKKLELAGSFVERNPILPILHCFYMEFGNNQLKIKATDLTNSFESSMEVLSEGAATFAVPAKLIVEILKALPGQKLCVQISGQQLTIVSESGKYKTDVETAGDFPVIINNSGLEAVAVKTEDLYFAISHTVFCASKDELRPAMTGVCFEFQDNELVLVATDGHRLSTCKMPGVGIDGKKVIIPSKALNNVIKMAHDSISISIGKGMMFFDFGNEVISCRLIDYAYPDYKRVFPSQFNTVVIVDKAELLGALKRVSVYADKTTNQVVLKIKDDTIEMFSQDLSFSSEAKETLRCDQDGQRIKIGFNARYLNEVVAACHTENVCFRFDKPSTAVMIEPSGGERTFQALLMPILLQEND